MKIHRELLRRLIATVILISMITIVFVTLQSCENDKEDVYETYIDNNGEIQTKKVEYTPQIDESFVMQKRTDKLVVYAFSMNTFTLTPAINIFKEKYPDVEVEVVDLGNDYETILKTELAAGKGPDLVLAFDNVFPDIYKTMATGTFVDLNQFILRDSEFKLNDYVKPVIDSGVYKGKRYIMSIEYGIPLLTTTQAILDEEKITPVDFDTFDDFIRIVEQYNEKYKDNLDKSALIDWKANHMNLDYFLRYSGIDLIDYEESTVGIDKMCFKKIIDFIKPLYINEEEQKNIDSNSLISEIMALIQGKGLSEQRWLFNNNFTTISTLYSVELGYLGSNNLTPMMFTMPNINNGMTANIIQFAAIPKASKNQVNAYNLLKIILSEDIQAGGTNSGNYLRLGMPVLKSGIRAKLERDSYGNLDEETINRYTNMLINVDSAKIMPRALNKFFVDEMMPYWESTKSFDDCYTRLVSKLEIYISE